MGATPELDTAAKRKSRYKDVISGVFGLVIGLSAYSLTDVQLDTRADIWDAVGVFVPSFIFVVVIWQITSELFDRYPDDDPPLYAAALAVLFLATLAPVFLNHLLDAPEEVRRAGATLFPLSMAITFAILALLWMRLRLLMRRAGQPPDRTVSAGIAVEFAVALYFLATLLLPYNDANSPRTFAWLGAFLVPYVVPRLVTRITQSRRPA